MRRTDPVTTNEVEMGKVIAGLMLIAGLWVGVEFFTYGPSRAFDGAFASFFESTALEADTRSTAQRAGDSVSRSRDEAVARRERMLGESSQ